MSSQSSINQCSINVKNSVKVSFMESKEISQSHQQRVTHNCNLVQERNSKKKNRKQPSPKPIIQTSEQQHQPTQVSPIDEETLIEDIGQQIAIENNLLEEQNNNFGETSRQSANLGKPPSTNGQTKQNKARLSSKSCNYIHKKALVRSDAVDYRAENHQYWTSLPVMFCKCSIRSLLFGVFELFLLNITVYF